MTNGPSASYPHLDAEGSSSPFCCSHPRACCVRQRRCVGRRRLGPERDHGTRGARRTCPARWRRPEGGRQGRRPRLCAQFPRTDRRSAAGQVRPSVQIQSRFRPLPTRPRNASQARATRRLPRASPLNPVRAHHPQRPLVRLQLPLAPRLGRHCCALAQPRALPTNTDANRACVRVASRQWRGLGLSLSCSSPSDFSRGVRRSHTAARLLARKLTRTNDRADGRSRQASPCATCSASGLRDSDCRAMWRSTRVSKARSTRSTRPSPPAAARRSSRPWN